MPQKEVLAAKNLTKRFGDVKAIDDVSFTISGPQLIGILGPNGAGKTTLLDVLEGLADPTAGEIRLFGKKLDAESPYPRTRVGVVLQKELVLDRVSVSEYAELFAAIYGVRDGRERIIENARLTNRKDVALDRISGGEAQRLFIAAAQVHDPDLLFLDEPTAHMDPQTKKDIGASLSEVSKKRTVVITTHDLTEADAICDYVLFLVDGKVRAAGTREELVRAAGDDGGDGGGGGIASAFFHFCNVRIDRGGGAALP